MSNFLTEWILPTARGDPYRRAAIMYLIYGIVYLLGAILQITPERMGVFFGFVPWWAFYLLGMLSVVFLPFLVWCRLKWFTRVLAFGPAIKSISLVFKQYRILVTGETPLFYNWLFIFVALFAAIHLFQAGWGCCRQT
ncbi:MAG: hypothetical protein DF168_00333 [Candidatus Moanabacter tarae]|uniref:Uncharacterized protein n=1 Tax=Candidatus Moanibacter tarae TaxID=2200854 RepID=A0A2Z4AB73_9BACT|nr:MAG: hypothetical protein DF168_00333 [Candidatus Moanabacter tarae]|tara:strand:- start:3200 stop:3613 length:414 start_codon:yes stop_codon:yes gene_type:complete